MGKKRIKIKYSTHMGEDISFVEKLKNLLIKKKKPTKIKCYKD